MARDARDPGTAELEGLGRRVGYLVADGAVTIGVQQGHLAGARCTEIVVDDRGDPSAPALARLERALGETDTLVLPTLGVLGTRLADAIGRLNRLHERGVTVEILDALVSTRQPGAGALLSALVAFLQRAAKGRTAKGLAAARARGRNGGRPKVVDEARRSAIRAAMADPAASPAAICKKHKVSRSTLYRIVREGKNA